MPRRLEYKADYMLLSYFFILLIFGLVVLTSATAAIGHEKFADSYFYIKRQLLFGVLPGLFLFFLLSKINYHLLKKYSLAIFIASTILLFLVFMPGLGSSFGTKAFSWLNLWGYSFQPAELAKFALIIFLAAYLTSKGKELQSFKNGFLMAAGISLVPIILVMLQPDIGTVSILFAILFALLFIAGAKFWHLLGLLVVALGGLAGLVAVAPYRAARFMTFLHPELDPQGIGYHINQAYLAIGSGGWLGRGLGHSLQKFQYLPEVASDSIFAIIAEEMGFIVVFALLILLFLIACRGFMLAKNVSDQFGRLLVCGIIAWFVIQSFLNIGAMVGLLPLTGVPLPFISHGGTALAISMGAVGILVNVSKQIKE